MKKLIFAALLAAVALVGGDYDVQAAGGPQTMPLDRNNYPIPVLRFESRPSAAGALRQQTTMAITYDSSSRAGASFDLGSAAGGTFPLSTSVYSATSSHLPPSSQSMTALR